MEDHPELGHGLRVGQRPDQHHLGTRPHRGIRFGAAVVAGGEAVEALAGSLWPGQLSAVSAIPDAKKGERLVLLTDAPNATRAEFLAYAKTKNAMDIMVPAEVRVGKVPVLGSGKVDFVEARKLALEPVVASAVA